MAERRYRISGKNQDPIGIRPEKDEPRPRTRVNDESAIEAVYRFGDVLGKGTFGVVREVTHLISGKHFAMKIVNKDKPGSLAIQLMEREVEMLNRMRHQHIISLEEVYETPKKVFLILELCRGGELSNLLKEKNAFKEDEAKELMKMLTEAVVYMHDKDMVHRDLKLENILVSTANPNVQFDIKVTDFGLSYMKSLSGCGDGGSMYQKCGTLHFMAPEIVRNQHEYSKLCDVWSMGVIMYTLLCGRLPFNGTTSVELENNIVKGTLSFSEIEWISISDGAKELIKGMLKVAPIDRLTARQILEDPWITGGAAKQRVDLFKLLDDSPDLNTSESSHHSSPQNAQPVPPSFPHSQESPAQIHVEKTLSSHSTNSLPRNTTPQKPHQNRPRSTTIGATASRKTSHPASSSRPSGESAKRRIAGSASTGQIQTTQQNKHKQPSAKPRESIKR